MNPTELYARLEAIQKEEWAKATDGGQNVRALARLVDEAVAKVHLETDQISIRAPRRPTLILEVFVDGEWYASESSAITGQPNGARERLVAFEMILREILDLKILEDPEQYAANDHDWTIERLRLAIIAVLPVRVEPAQDGTQG